MIQDFEVGDVVVLKTRPTVSWVVEGIHNNKVVIATYNTLNGDRRSEYVASIHIEKRSK